MDYKQMLEAEKTAVKRLESKIEKLESAIECAKIDMENHKISRILQNKVIDGLTSVIDRQRADLDMVKVCTKRMH